jgi:hypothetical protein
MHRVVIQLSNGDDSLIRSTGSQIQNLFNAFEGQVQIELVCHGISLPILLKKENHLGDLLEKLIADFHVKILACENMLKANGKSEADLFKGIRLVPSGVAWIVSRQEEGWSYIRAAY